MDQNKRLDELASRQDGVFNRKQVLDCGLTTDQIQRRLDTGVWVRMDTGVYRLRSVAPTWRQRLRAAILSRPRAVVAGISAAYLLGFDAVGPTRPEILVPFRGNARSPLARVIRSRRYDEIATVDVGGFEATSVAETILTLAMVMPYSGLERLLDHELAKERVEIHDFGPIFDRLEYARIRGLGGLRRIVYERSADAFQAPTSQLERMLYRLLEHDELPSYSRQLPITYPRLDATVDAFIPQWRLIVEADGRRWHTRRDDFERDRARDNAATAAGLRVVRFTFGMIKSDPEGCVTTLTDAGRWRTESA